MSRAIGWCLLPLLAACSMSEESEAPSNEVTPRLETAPSAASGSDEMASGAQSGGLTASVSALSADKSGLSVRVTDLGTIIDLPADALFDYDKAALTPAAETELRKAAELIRRGPPGPIEVIGHTDSDGDGAYNQTLSEARARTVAEWFGRQIGVRQRTFRTSGKGESAPIAPNKTPDGVDDPEGRAKNRRVEVVISTS